MRFASALLVSVVSLSIGLCLVDSVRAATYDDNAADLSNNQNAPTSFALTLGANSIVGSVGGSGIGGSNQDWIAITVPAGMQMTSFVNAAYSGSDAQGFTGFTFGSTFPGSVGSTASYAGYAHFGTGATNPGVNGNAATTTVGVDLLSTLHYMTDNGTGGTAAGASGYTPPLGPGTYTFLIQQTNANASISYEFDINTVPEPTTLSLLGLGGASLLVGIGRRRMRNV